MLELLQEHDLAVRSLGVSRVLERIKNLLQSQRAVSLLVAHLPDVPVGPTTNLLQQLVTFKDVGLDFVLHSYIISMPLLAKNCHHQSSTTIGLAAYLRLLMFLRNLLGRQSDETADLQKYDRITFHININENIPEISEEAKAVHDDEQ